MEPFFRSTAPTCVNCGRESIFTSRKLGSFGVRVFGGTESLWQTFSSVSADRNSEVLTRYQTVPVSQMGSSVLWSRPAGSRQMLLAGVDTQWVSGNDQEVGLYGWGSHGESQQWRLATHASAFMARIAFGLPRSCCSRWARAWMTGQIKMDTKSLRPS